MSFLAHIFTWLNIPINVVSKFFLSPIGLMPGWLSNTIIAAVTGILLLIIFKYTSNQRAIGKVRDEIKANMLALKLFKDSISVTLKSQVKLFKCAFQLLFYSIIPLLVMIIPVSLLLSQLGLWYQSRPLKVEEETIVTMKLNKQTNSSLPKVNIESIPAAEVLIGPVRVFSKNEICWKIKALEEGYHHIVFNVGGKQVQKDLAIGNGFMRLSQKRPGLKITDVLKHPLEKPFSPDSIVQSISINYPVRGSITSGTDWWMIYFFAISLVSALLFKPFLKVRI